LRCGYVELSGPHAHRDAPGGVAPTTRPRGHPVRPPLPVARDGRPRPFQPPLTHFRPSATAAHNYAQVLEVCDRVNLIQHGEITVDKRSADTSVQELTNMVVAEYRKALEERHRLGERPRIS